VTESEKTFAALS